MDINNGYVIMPQSVKATQANTVAPAQNTLVQQFATKKTTQAVYAPGYAPVMSKQAQQYNQVVKQKSILDNFSTNLFAKYRTRNVASVQQAQTVAPVSYSNNLRSMFQQNKAIIYAMIPRTFNAKDNNGDALINNGETSGTFINAIERLDEMKRYGINTFHILPIHPPGDKGGKGLAGSVYAPDDYLKIDPQLDDKNDPRPVYDEFKTFTDECHKRDMKVMLDLPSCASVDLYIKRPELMAIDANGNPETPQGWDDIRMFEPWQDEDKRILNPHLVEMHKKYIDMCIDLGVDGIRADVARAKPPEFWDIIIPYARSKDPEFAFLAESYTYEDASPMLNMPHDRPEDLLKAGFDSYYGQYHIFHSWKAKDLHKFVKDNIAMSYTMEKGKSLIGSFATHDDKSQMANGGSDFCNLTNVLQATLPMTNPYIITGYLSGDRYIYPYANKLVDPSYENKLIDPLDKDKIKYYVHPEFVDIFNLSRKPGGENPEIGEHFGYMMNNVRNQHEDVITKGSYIELEVDGAKDDDVIAYARHLNGKTLVVVANKDVNSREDVKIKVPGMKYTQILNDLVPSYGKKSEYRAINNGMKMDLGPAKAHVFEVDIPNIEQLVAPEELYRQNI